MVSQLSVAKWLFWFGVLALLGFLARTNPYHEPAGFAFILLLMAPYTYHLIKSRYNAGTEQWRTDDGSADTHTVEADR